ncbi:MAG: type III polyketide synthase [Akkermansiaceae bacterium]
MKLISIASGFPEHHYTQQQCLDAMRQAEFWSELKVGSRRLLEKVLQSEGGIEERRFALTNLTEAWKRDAQELNQYYEKTAPAIAENAVNEALEKTNLNISNIDALFVCTCTGYLCPGVSSYLAERLGMRKNTYLQDLTGLGCGAAIPMLEAATGYTALHTEARVLTVAVEICSAAFYIEDDAGVLISTCIFGDGASAAIWSGDYRNEGNWSIGNFNAIHAPESREMIRFTNAEGKLRNQLDRNVPELAANVVKQLYEKRSEKNSAIVTHGGGRDVILALEEALEIDDLSYAREVMRKYGNLSSPSVMVALELFLDQATDEQHLWMCGFGAGFSAHACELTHVK